MTSHANPAQHDQSEFCCGVIAIGKAIGLTRRQAFHLLENHRLPAKKVGGRWVALRSELVAALSSKSGKT